MDQATTHMLLEEIMVPNTAKAITKRGVWILALATLTACSDIAVRSDWTPGVDFSQFRTFAVLEATPETISEFANQRIRDAIVAELTAKGLQPLDGPDEADLAIGYHVVTEDTTSYQTVRSGWGYYSYESRRAVTEKVNITKGTLVIAAFRKDNKQLVWEGSASGTVDRSSSPALIEQRINDAVRKMFKDFPPAMTDRP